MGTSVSGIGGKITARRIQAPPSTTLEFGGAVSVGQYLNSMGGATLREALINRALGVGATATIGGALVGRTTATVICALVVLSTNVVNAINNISLTPCLSGPQ